MRSELPVPPTPRKFLFCLILFLIVLGCGVSVTLLERRAADGRVERGREALERLDQAVLSLAEDLRHPNLVALRGAPLLSWANHAVRRSPFNSGLASRIGQRFAKRFPGATVFAFNDQGRMVFQTGSDPRRTRETLWNAVVTLQRRGGGNTRETRFQAASGFCRKLYGSLTQLTDFITGDGSPRAFQDRGQMRLSWVIPSARIQGRLEGTDEGDLGGLWVILDPVRVPLRNLEHRLLGQILPWADVGMIVRQSGNRPVIEVRRGAGGVLPSTLRRFFQGRTEAEDRLGSWVARYIPQGDGRWLVAGLAPDRRDGPLDHARPFLLFAGLLGCLAASAFAWRTLWLGIPTDLGLHSQVICLFALITILPLGAVFLQGMDLARENARTARSRWEQRIQARHHDIDRRHLEYQAHRSAQLRKIEGQMVANHPLSEQRLSDLCRDLEKFEVVVVDEQGKRMSLLRDCEAFESKGQYVGLMLRQLAILIEAEGRVPDPALLSTGLLMTDQQVEALLRTFFKEERTFNRMQTRNRSLMQQPSPLYDRRNTPPRAVGLVSWAFDDVAFSRGFVEATMAQISSSTQPADPVLTGFAATDGSFYPRAWRHSASLRRLVERAIRFRAGETGEITFPDGRRFLAVVSYPVQVSGYLMIGLMECRPDDGAGWADQAALILGLKPPFPLEVEEVFTLRVLATSIVLSLLLMVPMAIVVSRWIVGRIQGLTVMVRGIALKRFDVRAEIPADDELGELAAALNEMAGGLQERERMSRFVSDQVLEEVKKEDGRSLALGGERRDVAVLFTHIHHVDGLVQTQTPPALIEMLNGYFTFISECITQERGSIDKLIGDAVMAVFFDQPEAEHPARRAFRAARAIMQAEEEFNRSRHAAGSFTVRTDLGIHFGPAISGKVGSRHGMIDFTVIGDTVNTAARIQAQAAGEPGPSLLFSREVAEHLPDGFHGRLVREFTLKGKAGTMALFKTEEGTPA
ncbi:MAG TPA: adenylate/guanylate cyclase domain-containing protein [Candidatus Ozemobacteraceae bacterium]|nr:adenylate/guanylate cyclase domain-containing protein [Candidatus Ozemobacteraceae bacterium]